MSYNSWIASSSQISPRLKELFEGCVCLCHFLYVLIPFSSFEGRHEFIIEDVKLQEHVVGDLWVLDLEIDQAESLEAFDDFTEDGWLKSWVSEDGPEEVIASILHMIE